MAAAIAARAAAVAAAAQGPRMWRMNRWIGFALFTQPRSLRHNEHASPSGTELDQSSTLSEN